MLTSNIYTLAILGMIFITFENVFVECNRANFQQCCSQGRDASSQGSGSCSDYSRLQDRSSSCKFAFTICCSQNKRTNECEKGKRHALAGSRCDDLQGKSDCDSLTVRTFDRTKDFNHFCKELLLKRCFFFKCIKGLLQLLRTWYSNKKEW